MASAKSGGGSAPNGPPNAGAADAAATPSPGEPTPRQSRRVARARKPEVVHERPNRSRERSTVNSIQPSRSRGRSAERVGETPNTVRSDERTAQSGPARGTEPRSPERPKADPRAIPDSVRDRFTQDGRRWYFPDGARAFRDHGQRLSTPSENAEVIASLVEIAKARGWDSITVRGSERFRQEAWKQAKLAGLEVRGYRANETERAALIRGLSRRQDPRSHEPPLEHPPAEGTRANGPRGASKEVGAARRDEPIVGKLLDHGPERYDFNPKADPSYFVQIETAQGRRVIWGLDLERAMKEGLSRPKIGDKVALQHRGSKPVTVLRRELDAEGKVLNETQVGARRNSWSVETVDFLAQREKAAEALRNRALSPEQVSKKHPELVGALLEVKLAELAARRRPDPRDREAFVARVRNALADEVARGEPLPTVQMREPRARRTPRERDPNTPVR